MFGYNFLKSNFSTMIIITLIIYFKYNLGNYTIPYVWNNSYGHLATV